MDEQLFYGNMEDFFTQMEKAERNQMHAYCYLGKNRVYKYNLI